MAPIVSTERFRSWACYYISSVSEHQDLQYSISHAHARILVDRLADNRPTEQQGVVQKLPPGRRRYLHLDPSFLPV